MSTIEEAGIGDAEDILDLQRLTYLSEAKLYDDYTIQPLQQTLEETLEEFERQVVLKVEQGGKIIGSVRGYQKAGTCYIGKLIVHPDFQNRGIGAELMEEIERHFGGADRYELFTGHRSEKNLYLYRKLGYRVLREKKIDDELTLVFMEKRNPL